MIVVSDASPLITFARIDLFHVLQQLFGEIFIAREVYGEIVVQGVGQPGAVETQKADWIRMRRINDKLLLAQWHAEHNLGLGEIATIILAKEKRAKLALIDERKARLLANSEHIKVMGSVAILEMGYERGYVTDLRRVYQELQLQGIRIDKRILNHSLASFNLSPL